MARQTLGRRSVSLASPPPEARSALLAVSAFAGAGLALIAVARPPRRGALVVRDPQVVLLESADLVAQPRRFFELEVSRGIAHALLEVGDVGLEVVADEVRTLVVAGVDPHAIAARHMGHD